MIRELSGKTFNPLKKIVLASPVDTFSGYGVHSRAIANALLSAKDRYDIKFISLPWGGTPFGALDRSNPSDLEILSRMVPGLNEKPDIWIQITIPSEMQRVGEFNILITAATEADVMPPVFVEGCNRADLILTPSEFTKKVVENTILERVDNRTQQVVEQVKVNKKIQVLFEGVNTDIYSKGNVVKGDLLSTLQAIPEEFCYLQVGHWLQGNLFCDRKDIGGLVHTFLKTFMQKKGKNRAGLILKTSGAGYSISSRDVIIDRIWQIQELIRDQTGFKGEFPSIYLLNGELNESEMNTLYRHPKVKAFVTLSKGEGYGLPLAEFALTGKPIICPAYSGYLDFINPEHHVLLPVQLKEIDRTAVNDWLPAKSRWSQVNYDFVGQVLVDVKEKYDKYLERSRKSPKYVKDNFSLTEMTKKFLEIIDECSTFVPERKTIKLPELKKADKPAIQLPKLVKKT